MMRPIPVHMGMANRCTFSDIRIFKFISVDLKGLFSMSTGRSLYALVIVCLQTKISEIILLDSRTATAILEAFNVAFSLYSTPTRITADKESGIIKIANNLPGINAALLEHHQVSIEFVPPHSWLSFSPSRAWHNNNRNTTTGAQQKQQRHRSCQWPRQASCKHLQSLKKQILSLNSKQVNLTCPVVLDVAVQGTSAVPWEPALLPQSNSSSHVVYNKIWNRFQL